MAEDVVRSATCACWDCVFDPDLPGCYAKESSPSHLASRGSPPISHPSKRIVCRVPLTIRPRSWRSPGRRARPRSSPMPCAASMSTISGPTCKRRATRCSRWCGITNDVLEDRDVTEYGAPLALAECGHNLYNQVFDRAARDGERVEQISTWLRDITETGQVESLEIVCDGQPWFAPWNLVYDERPRGGSVSRRGRPCGLRRSGESLQRLWRPASRSAPADALAHEAACLDRARPGRARRAWHLRQQGRPDPAQPA